MLILPDAYSTLIRRFARVSWARVWWHSRVLLGAAILAPGATIPTMPHFRYVVGLFT